MFFFHYGFLFLVYPGLLPGRAIFQGDIAQGPIAREAIFRVGGDCPVGGGEWVNDRTPVKTCQELFCYITKISKKSIFYFSAHDRNFMTCCHGNYCAKTN